MPPLKAELFAMPDISEEERTLREKNERMKEQLYAHMKHVLPPPQKEKSQQTETTKAVYRTEDQAGQEFTRAWLTQIVSSGKPTFTLMTDRIVMYNGHATAIEDSIFEHFSLTGFGTTFSPHEDYWSLTTQQNIELLAAAEDTVLLIEEAINRETLQAA
jgi:hypothetical protein